MEAVAHSPAFAKKVGVPQSVGKDFSAADKGRKFGKGGEMKESKAMVGKEVAFMKKKGAPAAMVKHEKAEMKGYAKGGDVVSKKEFDASEFDNLRDFLNAKRGLKRKDSSAPSYKPGRGPNQPGEDADIKGEPMSFKEKSISLNRVSPTPKGSSENKEELSDMTFKRGGMAKPVKKYAKGGSIDGIAQRGKTKGTMVKMNKGGKAC
jgi:hypothetical protein